ncbi:MAG: type III pantothenate kinase [Verrucomicrobiota bacterium]
MESGTYLLIKNNNTRTKFALASEDSLLDHRALSSREISRATVEELLQDWEWRSTVLASVVPGNVEALREAVADRPLIEVTHEVALGVVIDFPDPETVGADRLANAAAVAQRFPGEAVTVVDFGTAVTFDLIDQRPAYLGGVIAPGLDAMRHYLHQRTALLPEIELVPPDSAIGKSTEQAMLSGAFHGYRGLVREILARTGEELGCVPKVIATGGYAGLIAGDLPEIGSVEPYLTMDGLLRIARLNPQP